mmetsp:Transcript_34301/g.63414  ORF Transcript_34301/g.63414 Transcript_34301/m.63414 type:complete len:210 (+) Transcript_34301:193-822(+)
MMSFNCSISPCNPWICSCRLSSRNFFRNLLRLACSRFLSLRSTFCCSVSSFAAGPLPSPDFESRCERDGSLRTGCGAGRADGGVTPEELATEIPPEEAYTGTVAGAVVGGGGGVRLACSAVRFCGKVGAAAAGVVTVAVVVGGATGETAGAAAGAAGAAAGAAASGADDTETTGLGSTVAAAATAELEIAGTGTASAFCANGGTGNSPK